MVIIMWMNRKQLTIGDFTNHVDKWTLVRIFYLMNQIIN